MELSMSPFLCTRRVHLLYFMKQLRFRSPGPIHKATDSLKAILRKQFPRESFVSIETRLKHAIGYYGDEIQSVLLEHCLRCEVRVLSEDASTVSFIIKTDESLKKDAWTALDMRFKGIINYPHGHEGCVVSITNDAILKRAKLLMGKPKDSDYWFVVMGRIILNFMWYFADIALLLCALYVLEYVSFKRIDAYTTTVDLFTGTASAIPMRLYRLF